MSLELRKLNNYSFTNPEINDIIHYRQYHVPANIPAGFNTRQSNRFAQKYDNDWIVQMHGVPPVPTLIYHPNANLSLEVIRPQFKQIVLGQVFHNFQQGLGSGLAQFYNAVANRYLNIKRKEAEEFLKKQGNYVLPREYEKVINKPILAKVANERWEADLLDLSTYDAIHLPMNNINLGRAYILVVVDCFSHKLMARSLRNRQSNTINLAFQNICHVENTLPHILQCDGGPEFSGLVFRNFLVANNIRRIVTAPYTPMSNGLVERANKEIRKKIRSVFIANGNLNWFNSLQSIVDNINEKKNGNTKFSPNKLWSQGYHPVDNPVNHILDDHSNNNEVREYIQHKLLARAQAQLERGRQPQVFIVGDRVRVKMTRFHPALRRLIKEHRGKNIVVRYTPEIYSVSAVRHAVGGWDTHREQYELTDHLNHVLIQNGNPKLFYGSELIKIPANDVPPTTIMTSHQANTLLNRI